MPIQIKPVRSIRELKTFVRFPHRLYAGDPYYVPNLDFDDLNTLRKDRNPAFEYCDAEYFLAYREGRLVGRVAAILNGRYVEKWGNKYVRFGWLEFEPDFEAAAALMGAVEDWARSKGMAGVHGPMGFTDLDREGMLVEGFDQVATFVTNYNRPYYPEYMERLGYAKDIDWLEYLVTVPSVLPDKVPRVQELIAKRTGIHVYEWKSKKELVGKYGEELFALMDESYAHLYGTVPMSKGQVAAYIKTYLGFVDPRFTKVIVDAEERLIGFGISLPNLSRPFQKARGRLLPFGMLHILAALRKPTTIDLCLVAVKPEYQARGVVAFLMTSFFASCVEAGVGQAESNPELETNIEVRSIWKDFEKRQHKRRRAYLKML
jgi:hypothetical protein